MHHASEIVSFLFPLLPHAASDSAQFMFPLNTMLICLLPYALHIFVLTSQVLQLAQDNPKYKAIDRAIGKESFKVVTLLRLSPLLPLALSNYFYGITRY